MPVHVRVVLVPKILAIAAAYFAAAELARWLAVAGGAAVAIWPAAGIALAGLLLWGARCWPGVWIGAFASDLLHRWLDSGADVTPSIALLPAIIAAAASLQALAGSWLTRPLLRAAVPLGTPADALRFLLLGGPVACLVAATLAYLAQEFIGGLAPAGLQVRWLDWWASDAIGVMLAAPLVFVLLPGVRTARRWRALQFAVPLFIAAALIAGAQIWLERVESAESRARTRAAMDAAFEAGTRSMPLDVEALHGIERLFAANGQVSRAEFETFTQRAVAKPGVQAIEWVPRVPAAARAAFEAELAADGHTGTRIHALIDGAAHPLDAEADVADHFPVRFVVPAGALHSRLGLDHGLEPSRRQIMERALETGAASGTPLQVFATTQRPAILVLVPVYSHGFEPLLATQAARRERLRGFVLAAYDVEAVLAPLAGETARRGLRYRARDITRGEPPVEIAGTLAGGAAATPDLVRDVEFVGRTWRIEIESNGAPWLPSQSLQAGLLQAVSLFVALLVAFTTLTAAGRTASVTNEVEQRTAELETELAARRAAETSSRISEQKLAVTLDSIGDAVLATDVSSRITRVNPVAEKLTGWTQAEAIGRPVEEVFRIINERTREPAVIPVAETLRTGTVQGLANHTMLIARDGTEYPIADSAAPIRDADGAIIGVVLIFRDVSKERAAIRALAHSEGKYRRFVELAPFGVFVNAGGRFVFANPKALEILGARSLADVIGRQVMDFVHPDSQDAVGKRIRLLFEQREAVPALETKWVRVDETGIVCETTAVPHEYRGRAAALVTMQDITARKQAESQRDRFFDLPVDMLCVASTDGYFKRLNPAFAATLGWSIDELLARPFMEFVHLDDRIATAAELERLTCGQPTLSFDNRYKCRDGSYRWLSWKAQPQPDEGLIYATARDVTENKAMEAARYRLTEELLIARRDADLANRAKSQFLATMSHEIRTPMNGVIGMVDVLQQTSLRGYQVEMVDLIRDSAYSLLAIIDDILDFSKIEAGRLDLDEGPVDVAAVVKATSGMLEHMATRKGVELTLFVDPQIPRDLSGDAARLRQVLVNLVSNAIKFSSGQERQGKVALRALLVAADAGQATIEVRVSDNGIGMDQAVLAKLFTPFTQADASTTRQFGGTGLGLTIARHLVQLMGGEIAVSSVSGAGSVFTVRIALPHAAEAPAPEPEGSAIEGLHCVVVGGAQGVADDLASYLQHAGASVARAADLEAAGAQFAGDAAERPVWVIDADQQPPAADELRAATVGQGPIQPRFVVIGRGQRRKPRSESEGLVTVDANALTRRTFINAVALAAGRGELDRTVILPGKGEEQFRPPEREQAARSGRLILVAEDNETNQQVILRQLAVLGFAADLADDGREALKRWERGHYALVLTDLHMPQMDGYDLARAIRMGESGGSRIPIVAVTANALRGEAERCKAAGMDDYLSKPAPLKELQMVLERWLPAAGETHPQEHKHAAAAADSTQAIEQGVLAGLVGSDQEAIERILAIFRDSLPETGIEVREGCDSADASRVRMAAHRLKSSARSIGALRLGQVCAELERASREGGTARFPELLARFEKEIAAVTSQLEAR